MPTWVSTGNGRNQSDAVQACGAKADNTLALSIMRYNRSFRTARVPEARATLAHKSERNMRRLINDGAMSGFFALRRLACLSPLITFIYSLAARALWTSPSIHSAYYFFSTVEAAQKCFQFTRGLLFLEYEIQVDFVQRWLNYPPPT